MRLVALLDTSVASDNLGDEIIMDAVRSELRDCLPDAYLHTVPTHDSLGRTGRSILKASEFGIVGGTNILSSRLRRAGWKIGLRDLGALANLVMMGVGWRGYHPAPDAYSRFAYNRMLARGFSHSCRDGYSTAKLAELSARVLNTACPTMWRLTPQHCAKIPRTKARNVITALTFYSPEPEQDRAILNLLQARYERVYFWTQQAGDLPYLRSLGDYDFEILPPNITDYGQALDELDADFVGSRLHGGIRALQAGRRSLILAIDNRAAEIGRDTGLPVVQRSNLEAIEAWIDGDAPTEIRLPVEAIDAWKAQFREA